MGFITTTADSISSGGTITGNLTIDADLSVTGSSSVTASEVLEGTSIIDVTNTEAFLVRKNSDGGDVFIVDTTNSRIGIGCSAERTVHIMTSDASLSSADANASLLIEENDHTYIELLTPNDKQSGIIFSDGSTAGLINYNHSTNAMTIGTNDGATDVTISSDGDVGIGTTSPTSSYEKTLHIHEASGSSAIKLSNNTTGATNDDAVDLIAYQDDFYIWNRESAGVLVFGTNATERMRISANGHIGIGNSALETWKTDMSVLQLGGDASFAAKTTAAAGNDFFISRNAYWDSTNNRWEYMSTNGDDEAERLVMANGSYFFDLTGTAGADDGAITFTTALKLDSDSRISLSNNDSGTQNTVFGHSAGANIDAGSNYNVFIGHNVAGGSLNDATENTGVGYSALANLTTADHNTAIGRSAGLSLNTGANNTIVGAEAGDAMTDNAGNVIVGKSAFSAANSGENYNVVLGSDAGTAIDNADADYNILIGQDAGTGGSGAMAKCIAIGGNAMNSTGVSDQTGTIAIGHDSGTAINSTDANGSVLIGNNAGSAITHAGGSVLMGQDTGSAITTGDVNTLIGHKSGKSTSYGITTGGGNTALGAYTMGNTSSSNITGSYNTGIGYNSLGNIEGSGSNNTALGYNTLGSLTTGGYNVAIGHHAGDALTTSAGNVFIGSSSGSACVDTANAILIGNGAGEDADIADDGTIAIGYQSLKALTSGVGNVAIGYQTLDGIQGAHYNTAVGYQALTAQNTNGNIANTGIGYKAGTALTSGINNTMIGTYAGYSSLLPDNTVCVGYNAGGSGVMTADADGTIAIGSSALGIVANAPRNVAIGYQSGSYITSGGDNTLIGYRSGSQGDSYGLTTGGRNVALGSHAFGGSASAHITGSNNTALGAEALLNAQGAIADNTAVGQNALYALTTGLYNVAIGSEALETATTGKMSVAVGYQALHSQTHPADGSNNSRNTMVGTQCGDDLTSGKNNSGLGAECAFDIDADNQTAIGYGATTASTGANTVVLGNSSVTDVYLGHEGKTATAHVMQLDVGEGGTSFDVTNKQTAWIDVGGNLTTNTHFYGIRQNTNLTVQNGAAGKSLSGFANTIYWNHATLFGTVSGITNDIYISTVGSGQGGDVVGVRTDVNVTDADVDCQNIYGLKTFLNLDDGNTSTNVYGEYTEIDIEANHEAQGNVYGSYIKVVDDDASAGDAYGLYIESGAGVDSSIYATGNHSSAYIAQFYNDGNNEDRYGLLVQGGADDASGTTFYLTCRDGDGGGVGYIANTSGTFALTDPSDRRLKKDIVDTSIKGLETVEKMKVRDFEWKKSGDKCTGGFIAQELKEVFAPAVQGTDGAVESYEVTPRVIGQEATYYNDEDEIPSGKKVGDIKTEAIEGKDAVLGERIVPMGVSRDVLVPVLVKAIQELSAKVTELESKL